MHKHALVIEPCKEFREDLKDHLISIDHTFDVISTLVEARECLRSRCVDYSYVILSLDIPVRDDRPAKATYGLNLFEEIRNGLTDSPLAVIVMLDQCDKNSSKAIKLAQKGAFIALKPFDEDTDFPLEDAIFSALASSPENAGNIAVINLPTNEFESESVRDEKYSLPERDKKGVNSEIQKDNTSCKLEMVFYNSHVELLGVPICNDRNTLIRRILDLLKERYKSGSYKAFSSHDLEVLAECGSGQQGITDCICKFRRKVSSLLKEHYISEFDPIIINDCQRGYRFNDNIAVINNHLPTKKKKRDVEISLGLSGNMKDVLQYLRKNKNASRKEIENEFNLNRKTTGNYLKQLKDLGLVVSFGQGRATRWYAVDHGYYAAGPRLDLPQAANL